MNELRRYQTVEQDKGIIPFVHEVCDFEEGALLGLEIPQEFQNDIMFSQHWSDCRLWYSCSKERLFKCVLKMGVKIDSEMQQKMLEEI